MELKYCSRCKEEKELSSFRKAWCRDCCNEYTRQLYRAARDFVQNAKSKPCTDCGNSFPFYVMEFDHVPERGPKLFGINNGHKARRSLKALASEMAKCDLVCANCHRERTWTRANS